MDSSDALQACNAMWLALAEQIKGELAALVVNGEPEKALRWATYAEACLWKATGEADTHDISDVIPPIASHDRNGAEG